MSEKTVKVSIIVPVYNVEEYLPQCLDSLLGQTMGDFELLCVDDGSTDGSPDILKEYARRDSRVRLLRQQNQGGGAARNLGIDHARGEYLIFLDSDDFFHPELLEKTVQRAEETAADMVVFGARKYDTRKEAFVEGGIYLRMDMLPRQEVFSRREVPEDILQITSPAPWVRLYRRSFVESTGLRYQVLPNSNDYYFGLCTLAAAERIAAVPEALTYYRINNRNSTQARKARNTESVFTAVEGVWQELQRRGIYDEVRTSFVHAALSTCVFTLRTLTQTSARMATLERFCAPGFTAMDLLGHEDGWYKNRTVAGYARTLEAAIAQYRRTHTLPGDAGTQLVAKGRSEGEVLVSVIIPVHNTAPYLDETLGSITGQTLREIEILCIDDGSSDDSLERLLRWAGEDQRICVLHQENRGLSVTRNVGLDMAKGRYVYFMDSDDILEQDTLACLTRYAEQEALDVLFFDGTCFFDDEQGEDAGFVPNYQRVGTYDQICSGVELMAAMRPNGDYYSSACLQINRTDFLRNNGIRFIPGIVHEDNPFTFRVILDAERAGCCPRTFFRRRVRGGSIMTTNTSFANTYGYFAGFMDMNAAFYARRDSMSQLQRDAAAELLGSILKASARCYWEMSKDQRGSVYALAEDAAVLSVMMEFWNEREEKASLSAALRETRKKTEEYRLAKFERDGWIRDLNARVRELEAEKRALTKAKRKQKKQLKRLKASVSYRLGQILTWPFRKLKGLFGGNNNE